MKVKDLYDVIIMYEKVKIVKSQEGELLYLGDFGNIPKNVEEKEIVLLTISRLKNKPIIYITVKGGK